MNTKSLFYFVEAAKDMNFTHTARRLYISQQALSQHIGKLEQQYGIELFNRKPQLALSYAGEQLLPYAQRLLQEEGLVESIFKDIAEQDRGVLRVSVTLPRCRIFLPTVVRQFKDAYPDVQLDISSPSTTRALDELVRGDLSISIGILYQTHPDLQLIPLVRDPWYLLIRDDLLRANYSSEECDEMFQRGHVTLPELNRVPMIGPNMKSDPSGSFPQHYHRTGQEPNFLFTSTCPQNHLEFCYEGISAVVATHMVLQTYEDSIPENIHIFPLRLTETLETSTSLVSLAYNKTRYMAPYGQHFIDLVKQYFEKCGDNALEQ